MLIQNEPAYILHKRPYRETSQILDIFTRHHGRLSLISKGSRSARSRNKGVLQLFRPLVVGWRDKGELPVLREVESAENKYVPLGSKFLLSAMYVNELIVYLLHKNDVHSPIFDQYHKCLNAFQEQQDIELNLRLFEKKLLQELGFALILDHDADTSEEIEATGRYAYHFEHGPVRLKHDKSVTNMPVLTGESLIAFSDDRLDTAIQRSEIKKMMRTVLDLHLGSKRLKTRDLYRKGRSTIITE